jgi:type IV pilus modification protein PilV
MSRGFSLVEALVALAVLSASLLSSAVLLLGSLRNQSMALRHLEATRLVVDMADRIRANAGAGALYETATATALVSHCGSASPCDRAALAAHDLAAFAAAVSSLLPSQQASFSITFEPAIGPAAVDRFAISLRWSDARDPDATDEVTLSLLAQSPVAGRA